VDELKEFGSEAPIKFGDRIVLMDGGCVQQMADLLTMYEAPRIKFVAGFMSPENTARAPPLAGIKVQAFVYYLQGSAETPAPLPSPASRTTSSAPSFLFNQFPGERA
jgi:hypothetical protein